MHRASADESDAIKQRGGFPDAAFLVVLKSGYSTGSAISGGLVNVTPGQRGAHGFSPEFPEMRASFFAVGAGIAHHRDIGVVDMRQIAPTVAKILKVPVCDGEAETAARRAVKAVRAITSPPTRTLSGDASDRFGTTAP